MNWKQQHNMALAKYAHIAAWLIQIIITPICLCLSLGIFNEVIAEWQEVQATDTWKVTDAIITEARLNDSHGGRHRVLEPVYTYQYQVNGKQYVNDRQAIGGSVTFQFTQDAHRDMARHPVYSTLQIHYNPASPQDSVITIIHDNFPRYFMGIFTALVALLFPGYVYYLLFRKKKRPSNQNTAGSGTLPVN